MEPLFTTFVMAGALVALAILISVCYRRPMVVVSMACAETLIAWEMPKEPALGHLLGFNLYATDVLSIMMLIIAVMNFRQLATHLRSLLLIWLGFGLVLAWSLLSGASAYGLGAATNEARSFLQLYAGLTWSLSVDWRCRGGLLGLYRPALFLGWGLTLLAGYHALAYGINGADSVVNLDGTESVTGRVLVSGQAMALTLCAAPAIAAWVAKRTRLAGISAVIFAVVVIISQHRSVWVAAVVGVLAVFTFGPWKSKARMIAIAAVATIFAALLAAAGTLNSVIAQFTQAISDNRSFNARTFDWPQLIDQSFRLGPNAVLLGQPMGSGYVRIEPNGLIATFMPHNWYVSIFLRTGIFGSALFWIPFAISIFSSLKMSKNLHVLFMLSAILTYCGAYSMESYLHFFVGWSIVMAISSRDDGDGSDVLPKGKHDSNTLEYVK